MNIFVISDNSVECAEMLCDLRLNKMILETAQLLSTAANFYGAKTIYKPTHLNHPCSKWVRQTNSNYLWTLKLFNSLIQEKYMRTNKVHACARLVDDLDLYLDFIPSGKQTPFVNCSLYKELPIYEAYKKTMIHKWNNDKRPPKWTNRSKPEWYK